MQTKEWFENWFDSAYYPILYNNRDTTEAALFVDNLMNHLKPPAQSKILDIACGEGRFAKQLEDFGHDVIGIDLSPQRIKKTEELSDEHLQFFVHDMRFPFYVNYFDYAFNFFTSFGYFATMNDNYLAARSFSAALRLNGILVIDYFNIHHVLATLVPEETVDREGLSFHLKRYLRNNKVIKEISFMDAEGEEHFFEERVAAFDLQNFQSFFKPEKMKLLDTFGDYHLNAFESAHSPRLIMVFKKIAY